MTDLAARYPDAQHFTFGDTRELCDELLALVRDGWKTATCMPLAHVAAGHEAMPQVGRQDIVTDWDGAPVLVIETTEVSLCPFEEVPEEFALAEGEDATLESWQDNHRRYFERNGGWTSDMMLVCERFRVVEVL